MVYGFRRDGMRDESEKMQEKRGKKKKIIKEKAPPRI
jgi:hypothetical protein